MSIVEFLLARIAEDEEKARDGDELLGPVEVEGYGDYALIGGDRLRAECETKRRIVAAYPAQERWVEERKVCESESRLVQAGWDIPLALRFLASIYADHPDYDEAWSCRA